MTKVGFGNGGHYFVTVTNWFHSCCALARTRLTTFWSFRLCTTIAFPKMRAFILAWSWCWRPPVEVECLPSLAFFATKRCTSFKCFVNNHLAQYVIMQVPTLHFHFDPTFVHSLSFRARLDGQKGVGSWETWLVSSFEPKLKIYQKVNHYFVIKNPNPKILHIKCSETECKYYKPKSHN